MKNYKWLTLILAMLVLVLAACSSKEESTEGTESNATPAEEATETESATTYPLTVKSTVEGYADVTFEKVPEKIVVMDYGFLDTLDTLGVEVTGVAKGNFPEHLAKYADDKYLNAGTLKEPLFEDIAAMEPDAIFISGRQADFYDQLSEIAPTVFVGVDTANYWNSFIDSVNIAAELFGKQDLAEEKLAEVEAAIEEVKTVAGENGKALVTLYNETLSAYGPGEGSRFGYVHSVFGFKAADETLEDSTHGAQVTYEQVLKINPDILFVVDRLSATGEKSNVKEAIENDIINKTTAAQNGKIVYLDGALWYLVTGGLQSELAKVEEIKEKLK
ncbi:MULTISPECIES: siderophore ABC transporter substrate-binding protein [Lysinibacillus]|uniref:Ferrichrome ABC transporter substrate-binding protein n=1 Tax=Lysinibacillus antri TaxID=2498145 RepID=A0A3S0PQ35_9BACI|nr:MULTISPECIES: ABC transporter substrate-binding protein [Lysinibacillus]RUL53623.1 ferrichrome ABC transporter substrate-binding protein [Lysinibacillus antri]TSI06442.1 ABC transporter substrate-binding protein [Lysinibacillus sp. BW-2-10]